MNIEEKIKTIQSELPDGTKLIAVSKTKPIEDIVAAYRAGQRRFGENKVQELVAKHEALPKDIEWHMIGHLQTNKVKYIAPFVHLIHAVDSLKLLRTIDKEAAKSKHRINCLLQFHIAEEETKFGMSLDEVRDILNSEEYRNMNQVNIAGVMGMATYTDDVGQIKREFAQLKHYFDVLKEEFFSGNDSFKEISMGMSDDYKWAIEQGSTMVRLGSTIFGERNYSPNA